MSCSIKGCNKDSDVILGVFGRNKSFELCGAHHDEWCDDPNRPENKRILRKLPIRLRPKEV